MNATAAAPTRPDRLLLRLLAVAVLALGMLVSGAAIAPVQAQAVSAPFGPDVSRWQHPGGKAISWSKVKKAGNSFAIVKATEGSSYTNAWYAKDVAGARKAGLVVGAYHYARPTSSMSSAVSQARHFASVIGDVRQTGTMPPILDIESTGGLGAGQLVTWAQVFTETVRQLTGRTPVVYTYVNFWSSRMAGTTAFTRFPLWLAYYNPHVYPPLIGGWQDHTMWQYTDRATISGISGGVDRNRFMGTAADLAVFADGTLETPWPVTAPGAPTKVKATGSIRSATLTWVPGAANGSLPTTYTVTASPGGESTVVSGTRTSATVSGLTAGTSYSFTVQATNAAGTSRSSSPSSAVLVRDDVPTAPANVKAVASTGSVTITWSAAGRAPTSYRVYRCASETSSSCTPTSTVLATVDVPTTRYVDTDVLGGMHYRYLVTALNRWGSSARSAAASATPPVTHLDAPAVTARSGAGSVTLSWKRSLGAQKYEVVRCEGSCPPSLPNGRTSDGSTVVATVSAPRTSFTNTMRPGAGYTYAVRAVTGSVVSTLSAPVYGKAASRAPGVVAAMNHDTVKRGSTVTLAGRVNAAYAGERVYRQYWTGRSWRTVTSAVASTNGSYSFTIRPTVRSRTSYRVVLLGTATHMTGVSRTLRLTAR
jgi:GH25 family lysozyme M1 (1,4-beta-N-acetylmuramidase)